MTNPLETDLYVSCPACHNVLNIAGQARSHFAAQGYDAVQLPCRLLLHCEYCGGNTVEVTIRPTGESGF